MMSDGRHGQQLRLQQRQRLLPGPRRQRLHNPSRPQRMGKQQLLRPPGGPSCWPLPACFHHRSVRWHRGLDEYIRSARIMPSTAVETDEMDELHAMNKPDNLTLMGLCSSGAKAQDAKGAETEGPDDDIEVDKSNVLILGPTGAACLPAAAAAATAAQLLALQSSMQSCRKLFWAHGWLMLSCELARLICVGWAQAAARRCWLRRLRA